MGNQTKRKESKVLVSLPHLKNGSRLKLKGMPLSTSKTLKLIRKSLNCRKPVLGTWPCMKNKCNKKVKNLGKLNHHLERKRNKREIWWNLRNRNLKTGILCKWCKNRSQRISNPKEVPLLQDLGTPMICKIQWVDLALKKEQAQ